MPRAHAPGESCAVLLLLEKRVLVAGTHDGRIVVYSFHDAEGEEGSWTQSDSLRLHEIATVDGMMDLLPGLLIVGCAGQLSVRALPDLRMISGGSIATRCTGAFCLQDSHLNSSSSSNTHRRSGEASICAAMHEHLLLINVDNGADDVQVAPTELRVKRYAKIRVDEPVVSLLWRGTSLCIAHNTCYVVLDAISGTEIWRLHLRSSAHPLSSPISAVAPPSLRGSEDATVPRMPSPYSSSLEPRSARSRLFGQPRRLSRGSFPADMDLSGLLLAAALYEGSTSRATLTLGADAAAAAAAAAAVTAASHGELVIVEQRVWTTNTACAGGPAIEDCMVAGGNVGGSVGGGACGSACGRIGGRIGGRSSINGSSCCSSSSSSSLSTAGDFRASGQWMAEQGGRCWLDVYRGVWYRSLHEARPVGDALWTGGWRISFDLECDEEGWQYAPSWEADAWSCVSSKASRVRRRKWTRRMTHTHRLESRSLTQLLSIAGGQQIVSGEIGGGAASLLFDLSRLSMRPCVFWGDTPPDAIAAAPPLLLAFYSKERVLCSYHIATGDLLRRSIVQLPQQVPVPPSPVRALSATDWLDAAMLEGGLDVEAAGIATQSRGTRVTGGSNHGDHGATGEMRVAPLLVVRGSEVILYDEGVLMDLGGVHLLPDQWQQYRQCEAALLEAAQAGGDMPRASPSESSGSTSSAGSAEAIVREWLLPSSTHPLSVLLTSRAQEFAQRFEPVIAAAGVGVVESDASFSVATCQYCDTCSTSSACSRLSLETDADFGGSAGGGTLTMYEANCHIEDAVKEVRSMSMVLEETLIAMLPTLSEMGALGGAPAVIECVSEAIFDVTWPTLRTLYATMCANPDAVYNAQLLEMRNLLPQHMGLRRELWLLPTTRDDMALASLWKPADNLLSHYPPPAYLVPLRLIHPRSSESLGVNCAALERLLLRSVIRAIRVIQHAWRARATGSLGYGPYRRTICALREASCSSTPLQKAESVLRTLNLLALEVAQVLQAEASAEEIAADELLPLFVFVLVRARVPHLFSQSRFIADFLPKHYALGRHGYSLATLQAALQYLMQTSWAAVRSAAAREKLLRQEATRRRQREQAARQSQAELLVELCDCPYGTDHGTVLLDSFGRAMRRGDHIVRGNTRMRQHHAIFYGGPGGSDVIHHARKAKDSSTPGSSGIGVDNSRRGGTRFPTDRQLKFVSLEAFCKTEQVIVLEYSRCDPPDLVLHRARNELGCVTMDIFHMKCEQFAHWCKTGNSPDMKPVRPPAPVTPSMPPSSPAVASSTRFSTPNHRRSATADGLVWRSASQIDVRGATAPSRAAVPAATVSRRSSENLRVDGRFWTEEPFVPPSKPLTDAQPAMEHVPATAPLSAGEENVISPACTAASLPTTPPVAKRRSDQPHGQGPGLAACAGFDVYDAKPAHTSVTSTSQHVVPRVRMQRAHLLNVLRFRSVVYADASAAAALREVILGVLESGGCSGAGYASMRAAAQRKLADSVVSSMAAGRLAMVESGLPMLVPYSRRLAKKLGDLVQIAYLLLDWPPPGSEAGTSASSTRYGSRDRISSLGYDDADSSRFAADMQAILEAFAHGLTFESPSPSALLPPPSRSTSATGAASASRGSLSAAFASCTMDPSTSTSALVPDDAHKALHLMRLMTAAMHMYLETVDGESGYISLADGHIGLAQSPTAACAGLRDRLSLALAHGPRPQSVSTMSTVSDDSTPTCEFEARFSRMQRAAVSLDLLHALCRCDVMQQAGLALRTAENVLSSEPVSDVRPSTPPQIHCAVSASITSPISSVTTPSPPLCTTTPSTACGRVGPHATAELRETAVVSTADEVQSGLPGLSEAMRLPLRPTADLSSRSRRNSSSSYGINTSSPEAAASIADELGADGLSQRVSHSGDLAVHLPQGVQRRASSETEIKLHRTILNESIIDGHF